MRRSLGTARTWVGLIVAVVAIAGCSPAADVAREDLSTVVERDGVAFDEGTIPEEVLDRLAANRVVVLGETHLLEEHWAFVAVLLRELHARGFRQLLVERPQMNDWLLDDYVLGGLLVPGWSHPFFERRFLAIREFNQTLPLEDRIHVRSIDVNEEYYGGADVFQGLFEPLMSLLPDADPVDAFLRVDYANATPAVQREAIETLFTSLEADASALVESWGSDRFDQLVEMVDVERSSIEIRAEENDDRATRAREEIIKQLVDSRIADYPHGTVINIGAHHAQKAQLMGTDQEWLGDYLVHRSTAVDGMVYVVTFRAARIELLPGAGGTPFDVIDTSPENELFRVMVETWPGQTVFLPLDDPLFSDHRVAINSEETIYAASFKEQYDAILQYGIAHRMPAD